MWKFKSSKLIIPYCNFLNIKLRSVYFPANFYKLFSTHLYENCHRNFFDFRLFVFFFFFYWKKVFLINFYFAIFDLSFYLHNLCSFLGFFLSVFFFFFFFFLPLVGVTQKASGIFHLISIFWNETKQNEKNHVAKGWNSAQNKPSWPRTDIRMRLGIYFFW